MKVISWNVNGIRAVEKKGAIQQLIDEQRPDILLLQETKAEREQLSEWLTENSAYQQHYHSAEKKGYAGTGLWIHRDLLGAIEEVSVQTVIPDAPNANEGRVCHAQFKRQGQRYDVLGIYFPNGGKSETAWIEKLEFYEKTAEYMAALHEQNSIVIVGGDVNVAHTEVDIARPKDNDGKIGFHPKERSWVDRLIAAQWHDVWRTHNPDAKEVYSWWTMRGGARARNVGWRIDYFFMHQDYMDQVQGVGYLAEQMGSDHCPMVLELR